MDGSEKTKLASFYSFIITFFCLVLVVILYSYKFYFFNILFPYYNFFKILIFVSLINYVI